MDTPSVSPAPTEHGAPSPAPLSEHPHPAFLAPLVIGAALLALVGGALLWYTQPAPVNVHDQPRKIGIAYFRQGQTSMEGMKLALKNMGYTNIQYIEEEIIIGPTMGDQMKSAYEKMLAENVDLIWSDHEQQAKVALAMLKERQSAVPLVYLIRFHDPVEYGLAESFASSGNNATGVAGNLREVAQRSIAFLRDMRPDIRRIGIFGEGYMVPDVAMGYFIELKKQIADAGLEVVEYKTAVPPPQAEAEFNRTAAGIKKGDIDALMHIPGHFYPPQESAEYELAKRLGIPHAVPYEDLAGGGHFSYSANFEKAGEQSAVMVDKIFRGIAPSQIPIEYGSRTDLALHIGRAAESGVQFTDSMLFLAAEKRQ